eukprot:XP_022269603.1 xyloside xylosyltransferase 1 [Canis lupus familiaris]
MGRRGGPSCARAMARLAAVRSHSCALLLAAALAVCAFYYLGSGRSFSAPQESPMYSSDRSAPEGEVFADEDPKPRAALVACPGPLARAPEQPFRLSGTRDVGVPLLSALGELACQRHVLGFTGAPHAPLSGCATRSGASLLGQVLVEGIPLLSPAQACTPPTTCRSLGSPLCEPSYPERRSTPQACVLPGPALEHRLMGLPLCTCPSGSQGTGELASVGQPLLMSESSPESRVLIPLGGGCACAEEPVVECAAALWEHSHTVPSLGPAVTWSPCAVVFHDVGVLTDKLFPVVEAMQKHFSAGSGTYYSDSIFFLSVAMHQIMPKEILRIIQLDLDLKYKTNIRELFEEFDSFLPGAVIGIAREMQPVYRHTFWQFRHENPGTRVGGPPPEGLPGFNSGVMLLDLEAMRRSLLYGRLLEPAQVQRLADKYHFRGHLGDQDFFTMIGMEHPELFHVLDCTWNRQLCTWWRDHGYSDVFEAYFRCEGHVKIYHGNCNTPIPDA